MKDFFILLRTALRVNFGLSVLKPRYLLAGHKRDLWMLPLFGLALAGFASLVFYYVKGLGWVFGLLAPVGLQAAILTFGLLLGQFLILVFGFFYVISAFYFSRDLEILVPLPVKPSAVLLSKFSVVVVNEYLTAAVVVIPPLAVYGIRSKSGPLYWIEAAGVYLLLPVIPLALVALLVVGLMRTVNVGRRKDLLIVIGSLVLMAGVLALQFRLGRSADAGTDPQAMIRMISSPDGLVQTLGSRFPPSIWATRALAHGTASPGPAHLALFGGGSLFLFGLLFLSARAFFYKGLIGLGERTSRRKTLSRERLSAGMTAGRRPVRAVFLRELRIMNRTPIFLLNGVLAVILIPVVFVVMGKAGGGSSDATDLLLLLASSNPVRVILGAALFMTICASLNGTASSTFSREGGQFWMSKVIPASPAEQVRGKLLHSLAIALLGLIAASAAAAFALKVKPGALALAWPLALAATILLSSLGMIIDLARPLLNWTSPQRAIKQNLNVLLAVFADAGILIGLTLAAIALGKRGLAPAALIGGTFAVLAAAAAAVYILLLRFAEKRYRDIEV